MKQFTDEECYHLFIAIDDRARALGGQSAEVNAIRAKLLPVYRDWHGCYPGRVHPSAKEATAIMERLADGEQG